MEWAKCLPVWTEDVNYVTSSVNIWDDLVLLPLHCIQGIPPVPIHTLTLGASDLVLWETGKVCSGGLLAVLSPRAEEPIHSSSGPQPIPEPELPKDHGWTNFAVFLWTAFSTFSEKSVNIHRCHSEVPELLSLLYPSLYLFLWVLSLLCCHFPGDWKKYNT